MNNNLPAGMTSIMEDLDRYKDTFMTGFWPNSGDVAVIRSWLRDDLDDSVIDEIAQKFSSSLEVNVMGVGTGDGSMDSIIIGKFRQKFGKLRYTVIEPGSVIEQFKNKVHSNDELNDIEFDWKDTTFSEVCRDATSLKNKFVFISAIHSAYYFEDFSDSMSHLLDFLVDGGALMIIANSDDNTLVKFLDNLSWKEENTQSRLTEKTAQFAEAKARPLVTFDLPAQINVTSCFDETSEEGGKLLDFLTEVAYFRETASSDIKKETMSLMKSLSTEGDDGKLYFGTNCKAMIMTKASCCL
ncbi:histamine N-methyltransferase [Strongylocentrotus purpuratus]|uniref:Histamine N-methyltransferase n=1 Tax=Strongylocentrotus purpuratus TaxID=7668 RepID=A0A7M7RA45_STRPU|nr:histamine N-methyltransferase [Strongylocentrotus purpuratus]|eukprot:XP_781932.1 PREDICTED: histamine N-methyltransferase [Strongylocentrotus purpuratus]